ncbi:6066_t:CDS:2 [Diversispora eburnea]|uniref:6066_t:CDS:1 n=1 Tax=Diversispora eburnea TaxID=1213867 RepID=A0A9N8YLY8_9GLOM|nr:6066_t:CDS:2 [Diversispora eburnea]
MSSHLKLVYVENLGKESDSMQKSNIKLLEDSKFYKGLCDKYVVDLNRQQILYNDLKSATDIEHQEYLNFQKEVQQLKDKNDSFATLNSQEQYLYEELKRQTWKNEKKHLEESSLGPVNFKELENENKILHEYISNKSSKNDQIYVKKRKFFLNRRKKYKIQLIQAQKSLNEEREFNKKIQIESAELNAKNKYVNENNRISRRMQENGENSANKFKNENDALEIKNDQIENKNLRLIEENLKLENEIQNRLIYYLDLQANHDKELEQLKQQLENS